MIGTDFSKIVNCVACYGSRLSVSLDLGAQPLANDFLEQNQEFETFPLKLMLCSDCFHSQLSISVNPSRMFRNYSYISGTSETLSQYFDFLFEIILNNYGPTGKVLDIGSNDGSFLSKFKFTKWNGLGVDPAVNLLESSISHGVVTIPTFFNEKIADLLATDFDVIVAMNIFAHTSDPLQILLGIKKCLKNDGTAYIQTSQANMFFNGEFDTIYHEHISFFNVKSMKALLKRAGLYLKNVTIVPIHGNSYLWEISKTPLNNVIYEREAYEHELGLYGTELYLKFVQTVNQKVFEVQKIIQEYKDQNYKIILYGAAAKGNTFCNFAGIRFDYIFDDTPQKIGQYSPVGNCKVSHPDLLKQIAGQALFIITAWNFRDEIIAKIKKHRENFEDWHLVYFPKIVLLPFNS